MKNSIAFCLGISLLIFGGLACKNPLARYTKQYHCSIPGEAEPQTSNEYVDRSYKHMELNGIATGFDQCAFDAAAEAVRLDPQNADALALRGNLYRDNGKYDSALNDLNEAIRLKPSSSIFYLFRSIVHEKKNMLDAAIEDLSVNLKNEPAHHTFAKRGSLYFKKADYENALKDYSEAIRLNPNFEEHYTMRAEVYRKLGKNDLAEKDEATLPAVSSTSDEEHKPPARVPTPNTKLPLPKTISGGVLNGKATTLVQPPYPPAARAVRASGAVHVQVTIDENGSVIAASAVSGHPLLRSAAVSAARGSKFTPTLLSGNPVKVTGVIVYNFRLE